MSDASSIGYAMSPEQLNELWHYDMMLGHVLMNLPLRQCSAVPAVPRESNCMNPTDFRIVKQHVRTMWITASQYFICKKGQHGWGLFFGDDFGNLGRQFTAGKGLILGWLARVPSAVTCPTGHRYLRSPCCCGNDEDIYLGGPLSMANFDEVNRVNVNKCISSTEPRRHKVEMLKAPGRKISAGQEVLWNYNLNALKRRFLKLAPQREWQLDTCCSEVEICMPGTVPARLQQETTPLPEPSAPTPAVPSKRRKVGGHCPLKTHSCVRSFKFCTYCGINIPTQDGKKENMKRHWALKHTVDLCGEMGVQVDDVDQPVSAKDFMKHLDKVDHVYNSLNNHNYKVVPACNFLDIMSTDDEYSLRPDPHASDEQKNRVFLKFLSEGKMMFKKYQVLYLKGISVPMKYEDLLKPETESNYGAVNWENAPPSTNNFSLVSYLLTKEENEEHACDVRSCLTNAVVGWMTV